MTRTQPQGSLLSGASDPVFEHAVFELVQNLFLRTRSIPSHWRGSLAREIERTALCLLSVRHPSDPSFHKSSSRLKKYLLLAEAIGAIPVRAAHTFSAALDELQ